MVAVDKIRSKLVDKVLAIKNKDFLETLDKLVTFCSTSSDLLELTAEQKEMLQMSEKDLEDGRLISEEAMNKRNLEWLNGQ